jgi:hypothetical protein
MTKARAPHRTPGNYLEHIMRSSLNSKSCTEVLYHAFPKLKDKLLGCGYNTFLGDLRTSAPANGGLPSTRKPVHHSQLPRLMKFIPLLIGTSKKALRWITLWKFVIFHSTYLARKIYAPRVDHYLVHALVPASNSYLL